MGWRKTGLFHAPQEILVMTCDVCERDIGFEDGSRPRAHYEIARLPNPGALHEQNAAAYVCSPECLRAHADLYQPGFWRRTQQRIAAGEVLEVLPYVPPQNRGEFATEPAAELTAG
jgi:hypothetical protein